MTLKYRTFGMYVKASFQSDKYSNFEMEIATFVFLNIDIVANCDFQLKN